MWLLHFLPDGALSWVVNITLLLGIGVSILGFFASVFPPIALYKLPLQLIGVFLLVAGVYFKGSYSTEIAWRERVAEAEKKVAEAEKKAEEATAKIEYVLVDKVKVIRTTQVVIQEKIKEVAGVIDRDCKVAPEAVTLLNNATNNKLKK